jgi:hypothetical protein
LQRLAIPIGVVVFIITSALIAYSRRKQTAESYQRGREAREKHPTLARLADIVGVLLLLAMIAFGLWFFFWRK